MPAKIDEMIKKLGTALAVFDFKEAEVICDQFITDMRRDPDMVPNKAHAKKILDLIRRKKQFQLMERVAAEMIARGQSSDTVRRQHAQALIDCDRLVDGEAVLRAMLADDNTSADERAEAMGLQGRVSKQLYINQQGKKDPRHLLKAIESYSFVYQQAREKFTWQGINVVALLDRAKRDQVTTDGSLNGEAIAKEILTLMIEKEAMQELSVWDAGTAMEACIALRMYNDALGWSMADSSEYRGHESPRRG